MSTTGSCDPAERFSDRVRTLFERAAGNGRVTMLYDTHVYPGRLDS